MAEHCDAAALDALLDCVPGPELLEFALLSPNVVGDRLEYLAVLLLHGADPQTVRPLADRVLLGFDQRRLLRVLLDDRLRMNRHALTDSLVTTAGYSMPFCARFLLQVCYADPNADDAQPIFDALNAHAYRIRTCDLMRDNPRFTDAERATADAAYASAYRVLFLFIQAGGNAERYFNHLNPGTVNVVNEIRVRLSQIG